MTWALPAAWGGPTGGRPIPIQPIPLPSGNQFQAPTPGLGTPRNPRQFNPTRIKPIQPTFGDPRGFRPICPPPSPWIKVQEDLDAGLTEKTVDIQDAPCPLLDFAATEQYVISISPSQGTTYYRARESDNLYPVSKTVVIHTKLKHITYTLSGIPRAKIGMANLTRDDFVNFMEQTIDLFIINGGNPTGLFRGIGLPRLEGPRVTNDYCVPFIINPHATQNYTHIYANQYGEDRCIKIQFNPNLRYRIDVSGPNPATGNAPLQIVIFGVSQGGSDLWWDAYRVYQSPGANQAPLTLRMPVDFINFRPWDKLVFQGMYYSYFRFLNSWDMTAPCDGSPKPTKIFYSDRLPSQIDPQGKCLVFHKSGTAPLAVTLSHDHATDLGHPDLLLQVNGATTRILGSGEWVNLNGRRPMVVRTLNTNDLITLDTPAGRQLLHAEGSQILDIAPRAGVDCGSTTSPTSIDGLGQIRQCLSTCDQPADPLRSDLYRGLAHDIGWTYTCRSKVVYGPVTRCTVSSSDGDFFARYERESVDPETGRTLAECVGHEIAPQVKGKILVVQTEAQNDCHPRCEGERQPATLVVDARGIEEDFIGTRNGDRFQTADGRSITMNQVISYLNQALEFDPASLVSFDPNMPGWFRSMLFSPVDRDGTGHVSGAGVIFNMGNGILYGTRQHDFIQSRPGTASIYGLRGEDIIYSMGGSKALFGDDSETIMGVGMSAGTYRDSHDDYEYGNLGGEGLNDTDRLRMWNEGGVNLILSRSQPGDLTLIHPGSKYGDLVYDTLGDVLLSLHFHAIRWMYAPSTVLFHGGGRWKHSTPARDDGPNINSSSATIPCEYSIPGASHCMRLGPSWRHEGTIVAASEEPTGTLSDDDTEGRVIFKEDFVGALETCLQNKMNGVLAPNVPITLDWEGTYCGE